MRPSRGPRKRGDIEALGLRPPPVSETAHRASRSSSGSNPARKMTWAAALLMSMSSVTVGIVVIDESLLSGIRSSRVQEELLERFDELSHEPADWGLEQVSSVPSSYSVRGHETTGSEQRYVPTLVSPERDDSRAEVVSSQLEQLASVHVSDLQHGSPVAVIRIPRIDAAYVVQLGTDPDTLEEGPGLWQYGAVPGMPGNATIAGHRTTHGAAFRHIDDLVAGDLIEVVVPGLGTSIYEVRASEVVLPADTGVTSDGPGVRLTLTTCHPVGSARERLVVQAEMIEGLHASSALPRSEWQFRS